MSFCEKRLLKYITIVPYKGNYLFKKKEKNKIKEKCIGFNNVCK